MSNNLKFNYFRASQIITTMTTAPMTYLVIELSSLLLDSDKCSDEIAFGVSGAGAGAGAGLSAALVFLAGPLGDVCCSGLAPSTQLTHRRP